MLNYLSNVPLALQAAMKQVVGLEQVTSLFTRRGRAMELVGNHAEALANYEELEALGRERGDQRVELAALMARATIHSIPSIYRDAALAQTLADRALELARELGDQGAEAKILWNLMLLHSRADTRYRQAVEYGEQALAIARAHNLHEQLAYLLNDISPLYVTLGKPELGLRYGEEAQAIWRELNNLAMLSDNLGYAAMNHVQTGEFSQAVTDSQEALQISKTIGNIWGEAFGRTWVGAAYKELGRMSEAIAVMEEGIRVGEQVFPPTLCITRAELARLYGDLGDLEHGAELANLALQVAETSASWAMTFASAASAHLSLETGNLKQAEDVIRRGYKSVDAENPGMFFTSLRLADCQLALEVGDYDRAIQVADDVISERRRLRLRQHLPHALYFKGRALFARGSLDEAYFVLSEARDVAETMEARWSLWRIFAALSKVEADRRNPDKALELSGRAREIVQYIAADAPPDLSESFVNLPYVRELIGAKREA